MVNSAKMIVSRIVFGIFIVFLICTLLLSIGIAYFLLSSGTDGLNKTSILTNCLSRCADYCDNNNNTGVGARVRSR